MTRTITLQEIDGAFAVVSDASSVKAPPAFMPPRFDTFILVPSDSVQFDALGIPTVKIWSTGEWNRTPTTIAQWGLGHYARGDYDMARRAADWLVSAQRADGGFPLTFDHSIPGGYDLTAPWLSAITQGNAISLLSRLYVYCGFAAYRDAAIAALAPLDEPVATGGLKGSLNGDPWYEETPDPAYPNHIFNGSVFALLGIGDAAELLDDADALLMWNEGEASLRANINAHIVWAPLAPGAPSLPDPWGVYDLQVNGVPTIPNYLTDFYMKLHCELIEEMAARTGHPTYTDTAAALRVSLANYVPPAA